MAAPGHYTDNGFPRHQGLLRIALDGVAIFGLEGVFSLAVHVLRTSHFPLAQLDTTNL